VTAAIVSVLFAVIGQAIVGLITQFLSGQVVTSLLVFLGLVLVVLAIVINVLFLLKGSVDELATRASLTIRYFPLDPPGNPATISQGERDERRQQARALYGACRDVIASATEDGLSQIIAVNSYVEIGGESTDPEAGSESREYLATLEKKIGKVSYRRIVQLPRDGLAALRAGGAIGGVIGQPYRGHYLKMAQPDGATRGKKAATVEAVGARYPTSFVVVRNGDDNPRGGRLIWQMHEHVQDEFGDRADRVELTGVYIIDDPDGLVLGTFWDWFEELTRDERLPLNPKNLQVPVAA
jgi:hypothetical protein